MEMMTDRELLELAAKAANATMSASGNGCCYSVEDHNVSDPYAATRRAIVRAAAEIGRSMP